jgi:hypothetical protein
MIGVALGGQYGASTTFAQLLAFNGTTANEALLVPDGNITTFRTGGAAGNITQITATLDTIPINGNGNGTGPVTLEMVAWDDSSGNYSTWTQASVAWNAGLIAAGKSGLIPEASLGAGLTTAPSLSPNSFNLYFVPEPTSFALAGLGAAAMMIFRRRK